MSNFQSKIEVETTANSIIKIYEKLQNKISTLRKTTDRPLTISEKILIGHLAENIDFNSYDALVRGKSYVLLNPDRVALQDVTGQMTILQFMLAGLKRTAVPTTVHCDHLIQARMRGDLDTKAALYENNEVYQFLESATAKYGIGFWKPGSGIIHQVVLENYAFPGGMMIGTDSHTPNAGGLGMLAIGVGGVYVVDVTVGAPLELRAPALVGVRLTGALNGWAAPKDVILRVADILTTRGATGAIVEYFGPGAETLSATGKATICNMGAEVGATTSVFPFDEHMAAYLKATGREDIADAAGAVADCLRADAEVDADPARFYDRVIEIDLSALPPLINGPDSPALSHAVGDVGEWARAND